MPLPCLPNYNRQDAAWVRGVDEEGDQGHLRQSREVLALPRHSRGLIEHLPFLHEDVRIPHQLQQGPIP
jgi:hypothetical protein